MSEARLRIGIVAPASRIEPAIADDVKALTAELFGDRAPELYFHPQCHLSCGHFAGDDETRAAAVLEIANDASFDVLWFARGGYGSCRLAERILQDLSPAAQRKTYLGYSDVGSLLAALYARGIGRQVHGPMPGDISRSGGKAAVARSLRFLVDADNSAIEGNAPRDKPLAALNITILSQLLGTALEPDLADHVLMLEEVSEHMYRIDRSFFHITSNPQIRRVAGIMLGRCGDILPNEPDFGQSEEEIAKHWCAAAGIPYLGRADIGHDCDNKIVPFGRLPEEADACGDPGNSGTD